MVLKYVDKMIAFPSLKLQIHRNNQAFNFSLTDPAKLSGSYT